MFRLRTFGGLWLEGEEGIRVPAPPPRRLAVLAYLAASGDRGVSRERLLGVLWPDGDEERGRHALAQTVYSLRRDLGSDIAITGTGELRLDSQLLRSDIVEFRTALAKGDREAAARLYGGPFLDGFYLTQGAEFGRWVEEERARLAAAAIGAMAELAAGLEREGRLTESTHWHRRLAELDPLNSRYAVAYMRAMAAAGNRAGALTHARVHESAVRRDLEMEPDAEVTRLSAQLRAEQQSPVPAYRTRAVASSESAPAPPESPTAPGRNPRGARHLFRWFAGAILAVAAVWAWRYRVAHARLEAPILAVGLVRDIATQEPSNSGGVLTDMLATSLARIPGLQVVANSRLVELMPRERDTVRSTLSDAARRAGANQILEGELSFASDGGLRLDLRRIDLVKGVVRQGYSVRGLERYAVVDSATGAIARSFRLAPPSGTIAGVSTSSLVAYRLYEEGLRAFFQYDVAAAGRLMESALREDSTFAMAAFYAWRSGLAMNDQTVEPLRARAVRLAPRAVDRERLLILGMTRASQEDPNAFAPAESLAIRFPSDPDGQALLGEVQLARGDFGAAALAFRRAIALDSAGSPPPESACRACDNFERLIRVYLLWDSLPAIERTIQAWARLRPQSEGTSGTVADLRWRQGRWQEGDAALAHADSLAPRHADQKDVILRALIRRGDYEEVARQAAIEVRSPDQSRRTEAQWLWLIALRNQGRLREALALLREGRLPEGGTVALSSFAPDLANPQILQFESGDYNAAARGYRASAANALLMPAAGHRARGVSWDLALAGTAEAAAGDTAAVRRLADSVELFGSGSLYGRGAKLPHFLRGLLLASAGRHAEAVEAFRRAIYSWTEGYTRINYELAGSLLALHRASDAIYPLEAALRGGIDGSSLYLTRTELHERLAQAFAAAGLPDSAAVHYRDVVRAWEHADPAFEPRRAAAAAWLSQHHR